MFRLIVILAFLGITAFPAASAAPEMKPDRRKVEIAMLLWRGETLSEKGFTDKIRDAADLDPVITILDANGSKDLLEKHISAVQTRKFDLIYCFGTIVTKSVQERIKDTPIVFNIVARPIESGIIRSWEHSGNNVTGISNAVPMQSAFRTLALVMQIRKLGVIYNPAEPNAVIQKQEIAEQQKRFGFRLIESPLESTAKIQETLKRILDSKADAVLMPSDSLVERNAAQLVAMLNKYKIPTIVTIPDIVVKHGALLALGPDYRQLGIHAAENALEVLRGKKPDDVPSRTDKLLHLVINMKTATRLGITFPLQLVRMSTIVQ